MLSDRLSNFFDYNFNSVIANYYRNGKDTVPWHSDDEPMLGKVINLNSTS
jgi:alkylated DNA repair dioxygenase AlkB